MGETETVSTPGTTGSRHGLDGVFAWLRSTGIQRRGDDKWVAGVCTAVARRLDIDPVLVRGALLLFVVLGGFGVFLYLFAWAVLPNDKDEILAEKALHGDGGGIVLLVAMVIALVGGSNGKWWLWVLLIPVGHLVFWVVRSAQAGKTSEQMSEEAGAFAQRVVARVGGSGSSPVSVQAATSAPVAGSTAAETSALPIGATAPGMPQVPYAPPVTYGMGPGRTGVVQRESSPRVRYRRPRAGILGLLLTAGFAVAAYGIGSALATNRGWSGMPELVGLACALVGAGLALVVIGAAGRRASFTGVLVAAAAVFAVVCTSFPSFPGGGFGDRTWSAASQPAGGFSLTAGDATLDLAGAVPGSTVMVDMGAGDLTVTVPRTSTATVITTLGVGQLQIDRGDGQSTQFDGGRDTMQHRDIVVGTGSTKVTVTISLRAGEIKVVEAAS